MRRQGDQWLAVNVAMHSGRRQSSAPPCTPPPPRTTPPPRFRRTARWARLICCNVLGTGLGLLAILAGGEVWQRLATPFVDGQAHGEFVAGVGRMLKPNTDLRATNQRDYWTVQRTNSRGFLDREINRSATNLNACRVAVVGDSMVEAQEVAIEDKVQVQLEALARTYLPRQRVVANGFGVRGTGQIAQLAIFDKYVRPLAPRLVVLVFHSNDFQDNFTPLKVLEMGQLPWVSAARGSTGLSLRPPERRRLVRPAQWAAWRLLGHPSPSERSFLERALGRAEHHSWFVRWLSRAGVLKARISPRDSLRIMLADAPELADGWNDLSWIDDMAPDEELWALYARDTLPPPLAAGLEYTAFALAEFKARARRDGFALVLLTTEAVGPTGTPMFERASALAAAAEIDVVNLHDYIVGRDARVADASWPTDWHWSPNGHRWAAEAVLEYLAANQRVCG